MKQESVWMAYGYKVGYRVASIQSQELLSRVVLPNWQECSPLEGADCWIQVDGLDLYDGFTHWTRARDLEHLALRLAQLTQMKLTWGASEFLFLHGGVVKVGQHGWLLPGDSKAGKSTLVRALCEHGCQFYSDEYAVLDREGRVQPYPRALWERVSRTRRTSVLPTQLGWNESLGPVAISRFVFCSYRKGAHWQPQVPTIEEALEKLAPLLRTAPDRKLEAREWLARALASAQIESGWRGEASETARLLLSSGGLSAPTPN